MRKRVIIAVAALLLVAVACTGYHWWSPFDVKSQVVSYRGGPQDTRITVNLTLGIGDRITRTRFEEHDDRIVVTVWVRIDTGDNVDIGVHAEASHTLSRPIDDRKVIDASSGTVVPHA
ncbi:hypothetical protein GCM10010399_54810 [Dactylosporangium fulvum]|uniref:Uncharacterized protein n=1 Tax=Dactylosporangium fulvum TaxID=53359 RepID=A0ABY5W9F5_9ACTN|nr:hypothetical protein [Dactylosporangium fulvum]UWP86680.1 hypothetical protein Dfulv_21550 [Dactylosporangium fulvum]